VYRVQWSTFPDGTGMWLALDALGNVFNPSEAQIVRHIEQKGTAKGTATGTDTGKGAGKGTGKGPGQGPGPPPPSKGAGPSHPPPPYTPRPQTVPWEGPEYTGLAPASTLPSAQYRAQYSAQSSAPSSSSAAWYAPDSSWWSWWEWPQPSWQAQDTGAEKGSGKGTGGKGTGGKGTADTAERPVWHWSGKVAGFKLFVGDFPAHCTAAQCIDIMRNAQIPKPADHVVLSLGPLGHRSCILTYTDAAQASQAFAQLSAYRVSDDRHLHVEWFQDRHR
jgi:hypothetical protein